MRLAILGATSEIARDLVESMAANSAHDLMLYARRPQAVREWLTSVNLPLRYPVHDYAAFSAVEHFDAILNFVGVGNPVAAAAMGHSIYEVTLHYDELALTYVRQHPACRYIFLSSGAAYGASFDAPADANTVAVVPVNHLQPQDWYGVAKLHAECRHRALAPLPIVDVRVFNYFSHTQNMAARYLITDILRAIRDKSVMQTSADFMVRDYLHPSDFNRLTRLVLAAPATNTVIDCYSQAPIAKPALLAAMQEKFGLCYEVRGAGAEVNATGGKPNYYSVNRAAKRFGYESAYTSLAGVLLEAGLALTQAKQ